MDRLIWVAMLLGLLLGSSHGATDRGSLDLSSALIVSSSGNVIQANAADMLKDEVEARSRIVLAVASEMPEDETIAVLVGTVQELADQSFRPPRGNEVPSKEDGYAIWVDAATRSAATICVAGFDDRGALFGVGRLLRTLRMTRDELTLDASVRIATSPRYSLRGHQFGYRPKTNAYDAWSMEMWEQYYRDMIVFGMNAVEIVPPKTDDHFDSPHYPLPPMKMMIEMSRLADDYGLAVWIWYPGVDDDYTDPTTMDFALKEREGVFSRLPRIDAVFVPSGDPSELHPDVLFPLMEKQKKVLNQYHPNATIWSSVQNYDDEPKTMGWTDAFYKRLRSGEANWFDGMVFGPATETTLSEMRRAVPKGIPIRRYPDITHSKRSQYEVEDWDPALASTLGREAINPRPVAFAKIFRDLQRYSFGFISYSEGCNDDVNKIVWSALGWDPDQKVETILAEYSRYFIGPRYEDSFAQGLLALEANWEGSLAANAGVLTTLELFQAMERRARPQDKLNWRFQQALYRAYYDAYVKVRLEYETELQEQAAGVLTQAREFGSFAAMEAAEAVLDRAETHRVKEEWRGRVFELGEALYQSIRMQLSLLGHDAKEIDRGANLDLIDVPLNDSWRWREMFANIRELVTEAERVAMLGAIARGDYERKEYRWEKIIEAKLKEADKDWFIRRGAEDLEHGPPSRLGLRGGDPLEAGLVGIRSGDSDFSEPFSRDVLKQPNSLRSSDSPVWSGYWTGYIEAPYTGEVCFATDAASGFRLSINDKPVIDTLGRIQDQEGRVQMEQGHLYPIRLYFSRDNASDAPRLYWSWLGRGKSAIEANAFSFGPENEKHVAKTLE